MEDAQIMPRHLLKGLSPQRTKIAPLGRDFAICSTVPIKNLTFQPFTSKVPEGFTFGLAKSQLYKEAGSYGLCSSFKAEARSVLIHGRRNFSSGPPVTENIPKMNSCKKVSSVLGNEKPSGAEGQCDCSSRRDTEEFVYRVQVCALGLTCVGVVLSLYNMAQLYSLYEVVDDLM